jgi:threonine synthase
LAERRIRQRDAVVQARGLALAVNGALALGKQKLALPSAGNAGSAAAAYAAAAGIACRIAIPDDTPEPFALEQRGFGAEILQVPGTISDAGRALASWAPAPEVVERRDVPRAVPAGGQEDARLRDRRTARVAAARSHLLSYGGGTGLVGMWRAFQELAALGWTSDPPPRPDRGARRGRAPGRARVRARRRSRRAVAERGDVAAGCACRRRFADRLILRALRETGGEAVGGERGRDAGRHGDDDRSVGQLACPEGGATLAALGQAPRERDGIGADARVVLFNTGSRPQVPRSLGAQRSRVARSALVRHARPRRTRTVVIALATLALLLAVSAAGAKHATPAVPVYVTRLEGVVSPVMAEALDRALARRRVGSLAGARHRARHARRARVEHARHGEADARRESARDRVDRAEWRDGRHRRACSITMAADVAAMAPGTNIGAADADQHAGPDGFDARAQGRRTMPRRSLAPSRISAAANAEWAEDAVRHAVAASETEAVDLHVVDFVSGSLSDVLERADGRSWRRGDDTRRSPRAAGPPSASIRAFACACSRCSPIPTSRTS